MLTIFIGTVDLCLACKNPAFNPANYSAAIEAGLDLVLQNIPQVFVNLLPPPDVSQYQMLTKGLTCKYLHRLECPCFDDPSTPNTQFEYFEALSNLASQPKYQIPGMNVVVQPFTLSSIIPSRPDGSPDYSFLAPDCFNLSLRGQLAYGKALYTNLQQSLKQPSWNPASPFQCFAPGEVLQ